MISSNGEVQYSNEMSIDDFSDTTPLTNEDIAAILSSTDSMLMDNNGGLNRNNGLEKPVRKRSRASKHTPSTFLIAKTSDFRALVQQLTGCQSADSYKGPINLNFGAAEDEMTDVDKVSTIPTLEFNFYNHITQVKNHHEHQQQQQHQHQHRHQQQQRDLEEYQRLYEEQESSSSNGGNAFVSAFSSPGPCSMTGDDLALENIFLHDSSDYGDYSSNGIGADHEAIVDGEYSSDYRFADDNILLYGYSELCKHTFK